jgi:hypothetical protein
MSGPGMKVSFFAQPDLKNFLPEAAQPFFQGEMVAGGFKVDVVYEPAPINPNVWHDGTTFFQTPGKPRLRPISLQSHCDHFIQIQGRSMSTSGTLFSTNC